MTRIYRIRGSEQQAIATPQTTPDIAIPTLAACCPAAVRRLGYLRRGHEIQQGLKTRGRLPPNRDGIGWFEEHLQDIDGDRSAVV